MIPLPCRKMRTTAFALVALLLSCHIFSGFCAMVPPTIAGTPEVIQADPLHMDIAGGCPDSLVNSENREFPHGELVATLPEADTPRLQRPGSLVSTGMKSQTYTPLHVTLLPVLRI